ncbi:MAG: thiamine pyrophosphate-binding protein, partial [Deltaproteobacteria bacterium]|nr:thiamine pyrophosphate-binding protein [Deltaproteobacteria bacterium]
PLVKWSVEARSADELPLVLHRAFKTAREAPSGPVFVSLPMNVMEQETAQGALPAARLFARGAAAPEGIREAAQALLKARRPLIFCGNGLGRAGALAELVALAELTGAPVYDEVLPSRVNFPHSHAHYRDQGYGDQAQLRKLCGDADVILLVAGEFFEEVWFKEDSPFPEDAVLIQIEDAESNLARNYPVQCGLLGDPARTLQAIQAELLQHAPAGFHAAAETRRGVLREQKAQDLTRHQQRLTSGWDRLPMSTARLMHELRQALPPEVTISNEVITANPDLLRTLSLDTPRDMIASRGGGIGQALPSAIGIKLAWPERPVVALSGDGSSLYTLQCLWTAAHHKIPVVFCILNNGGYRILKLNMNRYRQDSGIGGERPYPHMDLTEPSPDYVSLARGYGVPGQRVDSPDAVGPALRQALDSGGPYLLEFVVDGRV